MKAVRMIFPAPDIEEDQVLINAEGPQGSLVIFCTSECRNHVHFSYSICGTEGEGKYLYVEAEKSKEEAAKELFAKLNMMIEMETLNERRESTVH